MLNFIKKILPSQGTYCVAKAVTGNGKSFFRHVFWNSVEDAYENALALDRNNDTVFIAQATFRTSANRRGDNALSMRSFFLDIDCGEGKPYPDQVAGIQALKSFCTESGLPIPAVVNSGNGLYAYWPISQDMSIDQWKGYAKLLKALCDRLGFHADPARTSDTASVLRPIGSYNKKIGKKLVSLIRDVDPMPLDEFTSILNAAVKKYEVSVKNLIPVEMDDLNSSFMEGLSGPPALPDLIAEKCPQMRHLKVTKGNVPEPYWYAGIGVLRHCEDGINVIHAWSTGHPDYDFDETESKIEQHKFPPTTCVHFNSINPGGCSSCSHINKIKTPIVLGRATEKVFLEDHRCPFPEGFVLTEDGIYYEADNIKVYPYDIYPESLSYDATLGYEVVTFKHKMPHIGWEEFTIRSSAMHEPKTLLMALHDNHVQVVGSKEKKLMISMIEQHVARLRQRKALVRLYSQQGWKGKDFILGDTVYSHNARPAVVGFSKNVPDAVRAITQQGDMDAWINATEILGAPGMEAHAFTLLAGAFGAPLMEFSGYEGAVVACVGSSGTGKTLMAKWVASAYGDFTRLMMLKEDTKNSLIARLGVYGSLPLTIDEVSNIAAPDLSDLVYRVTQGRDKTRLSRSAVERANINSWRTIAIVSSNHSLTEKLAGHKSDASAELNRVFEIPVKSNPAFTKEILTNIHRTIAANYGDVGMVYAQYLVDHYDEHIAAIDKISLAISKETHAEVEERFWIAVAAVTLYGGYLAQKIGLIKFDITAVKHWVIDQIRAQQRNKKGEVRSCASLLGAFLSENAGSVLVVTGSGDKVLPLKMPYNSIVARYETHTKLLYISRDAWRTFLIDRYASYKKTIDDFNAFSRSPLISTDKRKSLTAGVEGIAGAPINTWILDMAHPELGGAIAEIVTAAVNEGDRRAV